MKITIVQGAFLPVPPLLGGAVEKVWYDLGREFVKSGHLVTHISRCYGELPASETIEGVTHVRCRGYDTPRSILILKFLDLMYSIRARRRLPDADILVTNTFWLPVLVRNKRYGKLYIHVARYPKGQMFLYRHADRLQTVSRPIAEEMECQIPAHAEKIIVIPYPIPPDVNGEKIDGDPSRRKGPFRLLYVGRIHPEKGIHLIFEAIARLEAVDQEKLALVVVGPWEISQGGGGREYFETLEDLRKKLRCSVEMMGPIYDRDELGQIYRSADLFIYPSLAEKGETFGLSVLEAMSFGCVPLVSGLDCFRDFVRENENGFVFDHRGGNAAGTLAEKLKPLIGSKGRLRRMANSAQSTAKEYALEKISVRYLDDFHSLLKQ